MDPLTQQHNKEKKKGTKSHLLRAPKTKYSTPRSMRCAQRGVREQRRGGGNARREKKKRREEKRETRKGKEHNRKKSEKKNQGLLIFGWIIFF